MDNKELVVKDDMSDAEFLAQLNDATGGQSGNDRPMTLTFNSVNKVFSRETTERDADNKPVWEEIGESVIFHIILTKNQWMNDKQQKDVQTMYSNEHYDFKAFEIVDTDGAAIFNGDAKQLKNDKPDLHKQLKFRKILYVFAEIGDEEPTLYRMILKGSSLGAIFDYTKLFIGSNMAMVKTVAQPGKRMIGSDTERPRPATQAEEDQYASELKAGRKPAANLYYGLSFNEESDDVEKTLIRDRVNAVNAYINAREQNNANRKDNADVVADMGGTENAIEVLDGKSSLAKSMGFEDKKTEGEEIDDEVNKQSKGVTPFDSK